MEQSTPRVMVVYGTRPEAVKLAPLIRELRRHADLQVEVVVTGQHRDMLQQVNDEFGIEPDVDLQVMTDRQGLVPLASTMLDRLAPVLAERRPDLVVVQGDTTTTTVAALAAFYERIPVAHVEAGLRSGDMDAPFPEEGNRRITSQLARLHLAPTAEARANLLAEGIAPADIVVTGNTVIDALLEMLAQPARPLRDAAVQAVLDGGGRTLLVTAHRRESWDGGIAATARALRRLADAYPDLHIVLPMHRNPVVRAALEEVGPRVLLTEPMDYPDFTRVLAAADVILTDSGGIQEEAPALGRPVLVTRDTTERPEAVAAGTVRLVGTDEDAIVAEVSRLLDDPAAYARMARATNPYGDGRAAIRCAAAIRAHFGLTERAADFTPF